VQTVMTDQVVELQVEGLHQVGVQMPVVLLMEVVHLALRRMRKVPLFYPAMMTLLLMVVDLLVVVHLMVVEVTVFSLPFCHHHLIEVDPSFLVALMEAVLMEAVLKEAVLMEAVLTEAVLTEVVLTEAVLTEAVLTEAVLMVVLYEVVGQQVVHPN
jgi:hypothetical protein